MTRNRKARISRKAFLWVGGGVALLILVAVVAILVHRSKAESALAEKLAELEAAGIPTTLVEINRRYHEHGRDPAENAAPVYEKAFERKVVNDAARDELGKAVGVGNDDHSLEAETLQAIADLVEANNAAIQLLKDAAAMPYLRAAVDLTDAPITMLPHLGKMRESGRLLAGEAIVAAEANDPERAAEAVMTIFQMAYHLGEEPVLVSQLTRIALESIGRTALERTLERVELTPAALVSLRRQLDVCEKGPRLEGAFRTELAMAKVLFENITKLRVDLHDEEFSRWERPLVDLFRASGILAKNQHFYLTKWKKFCGWWNCRWTNGFNTNGRRNASSAAIPSER